MLKKTQMTWSPGASLILTASLSSLNLILVATLSSLHLYPCCVFIHSVRKGPQLRTLSSWGPNCWNGPHLRTWSSWGPNCWNGPHLVLILHKRPHLPQIWYIMGFESVFLYLKWRNIEISNTILLYMHLLGNGMYNSHTITNTWAFVTKCVML